MSVYYKNFNPDQLPSDDLSEQEKMLLQTHLKQERILRWRKLAGPKPRSFKEILLAKKWIWLVAILIVGALIYWQTSGGTGLPNSERAIIASRTDLLEYPFDNITVRGGAENQNTVLPAHAIASYRNNDFESALRSAGSANHFFNGICWLQLKNAQRALNELEQVSQHENTVGDEFYYYQGVALQDLGRQDEANQAFQKVLKSRTVREPFRSEVAKRIKN